MLKITATEAIAAERTAAPAERAEAHHLALVVQAAEAQNPAAQAHLATLGLYAEPPVDWDAVMREMREAAF